MNHQRTPHSLSSGSGLLQPFGFLSSSGAETKSSLAFPAVSWFTVNVLYSLSPLTQIKSRYRGSSSVLDVLLSLSLHYWLRPFPGKKT